MDVLTAVKGRRSIREFTTRQIEPVKLDALKDALIWAPSAGNLQSRRFFFIFNDEVKKNLVRATLGQGFISRAPLVVVGCVDNLIGKRYGDKGVNRYCIQDLACSIENMMLTAYSLGLGSVWVGDFHEDGAAGILNLPENLWPQAIVPVGYPDEDPLPPERMSRAKAIVEIR